MLVVGLVYAGTVSAGCEWCWSVSTMILHTCSIGDRSGDLASQGSGNPPWGSIFVNLFLKERLKLSCPPFFPNLSPIEYPWNLIGRLFTCPAIVMKVLLRMR
ncbi:hypothetical protein TNCV_1617321 [Trichonephila clavipes]|nr:hypothetical protein TNCV_1617321 [Trichonephila clavipes]